MMCKFIIQFMCTEFSILYQIQLSMKTRAIFLSLLFVTLVYSECVHDLHNKDAPRQFLNDLTDGRLLQGENKGRIRIFVDYTQVNVGGQTEINMIKRVTNITATYFYNVLNVTRLPRLYYPKNESLKCNALTVPKTYVDEGTIGDLGIICGNENSPNAVYVAKSTPCAFLQSTKRPIWGIIVWNNPFLKYDQEGFQQILFVGIHEITHVIGFSALMYDLFPAGNLLVTEPETGNNYLNSPKIQQVIKKHFGCNSAKGLLLEDQDGTLIASHWEQKVVGNEFMIASNKKGSFMSQFTLAFFDSMGWYDVDYEYMEPTVFGKNEGCQFLNIDNCEFPEFCNDNKFHCDWDATAIGRCSTSPFTGTCSVVKYFTNTICIDENYQLKNLNSKLSAYQRGGSNSRCFISDYRQEGKTPTKLNNRCYVSVCSISGKFVFILVGSYIMVCRSPNQVIPAPPSLQGTLTCPSNFVPMCQSKKTCPYHCNKNGACINGQCLCTGSLTLTPTCLDVSIFVAPVGSKGGLLNILKTDEGRLTIQNGVPQSTVKNETLPVISGKVRRYSINSKCMQGAKFDEVFGQCLPCKDVFNCQNCDDVGCVSCDNNKIAPVKGECPGK